MSVMELYNRKAINKSLLVSLVQKSPSLYAKDQDGNTKSNRERCWKEIAAQLQAPAEDCQSVWKDIRDRYVRERRKISLLPPWSVYKVPWSLFNSLHFLEEHIKSQKDQKKPQEIIQVVFNNEKMINCEYEDNSSDGLNWHNSKEHRFSTNHEWGDCKKDPINTAPLINEDVTLNEIEAGILNDTAVELTKQTKNEIQKEADLAFGHYIGLQLHTFNSEKKRRLKRKILDLLEAD